jgi:hypothetical protein
MAQLLTNGLDKESTSAFVADSERYLADIASAVIKKRALEARVAALPEKMEDDDRDMYELVVEAVAGLEGTPLGDAAVAADKRAGRGRKVRKDKGGANKLRVVEEREPAV